MVVTGVGDSIASAQQRQTAWQIASLSQTSSYRRDIDDRLMAGDYAQVEKLGLLDATSVLAARTSSKPASVWQRGSRRHDPVVAERPLGTAAVEPALGTT